jgi:alpha-galactosidase
LRVGPDVAPFWLNKPLSVWLNNPNDTSTQNAIRTSLHRLWLSPLVHVDPDVAFFRSKYNRLTSHQKRLLQDLALISGFKATSDLPQWLNRSEKEALREFLETTVTIQKQSQYRYQIDGREVDFEPAVLTGADTNNIPIWLARNLGLMKIAWYQACPAISESLRLRIRAFQDK